MTRDECEHGSLRRKCNLCFVMGERDKARAEVERLRAALSDISGWFIPGQRNTYLPGDQTLDRIRDTAEAALKRGPA